MASLADHLALAVEEHFAPTYPRMPGRADPDAAVAFMLPPFTEIADDEIVAAWRRAAQMMERPAGGVAPGAGWRNDGVSWTPQTSLFALTAASTGHCADAAYWLDWLDEHRTGHGSLPEKVLADGSPAAVAPLTWTAANVILAVAAITLAASTTSLNVSLIQRQRERSVVLENAALAGLEEARSRLNGTASLYPDSSYVVLDDSVTLSVLIYVISPRSYRP